MKRKASAVWQGGGKEGTGTLTTTSGALKDQPYSAALRFQSEDGRAGTNPEELIAAAHAGCFAMALSFRLEGAGFKPEELRTDAVVTIEKDDGGWTSRSSDLTLRAKVPGISPQQFQELAEAARATCPVSRALNATIRLEAKLV
ncbi:MAG: OsmC family peroxiredoxin [Longimicrobiales bacterium]